MRKNSVRASASKPVLTSIFLRAPSRTLNNTQDVSPELISALGPRAHDAAALQSHLARLNGHSTTPTPPPSLLPTGGKTHNSTRAASASKSKKRAGRNQFDLAPEIFRVAPNRSYHYRWYDLQEQEEAASLLTYNFSDGQSVSSLDILKHSYSSFVPADLLPTGKPHRDVLNGEFNPWESPVHLSGDQFYTFRSPQVDEIETSLVWILHRLGAYVRANQIAFFVAGSFDKSSVHERKSASQATRWPIAKDAPYAVQNTREFDRNNLKHPMDWAIQINELVFDSHEYFRWTLDCTPELKQPSEPPPILHGKAVLDLRPTNPADRYIGFDHFAIELNAGRIHFRNWTRECMSLMRITSHQAQLSGEPPEPGPSEDDASGAHEILGFPLRLKVPIRGHSLISVVAHDREYFAASSFPFVVKPTTTKLSPQQITPRFQVDASGLGRIAYRLCPALPDDSQPSDDSQSGFARWNFSARARGWIWSLVMGLPAYLDFEPTSLATRGRRGNRALELRLLRHMGLQSYLFYEASHAALNSTLSDGTIVKTPKDVLRNLDSKLLALLLDAGTSTASRSKNFVHETDANDDDDGEPSNKANEKNKGSLKSICSPKVYAVLTKYVELIFGADDEGAERVYTSQGEWVLDDIGRHDLRLLNRLIESIAIQTNGECFRKVRTGALATVFEDFFHGTENELAVLTTLPPPPQALVHIPALSLKSALPTSADKMRFLATLAADGFETYWDTQPLIQLAETDFVTTLTLAEQTETKGSRMGGDDHGDAPESGAIDWFELHPKFFLMGKEITPDQARLAARDGIITHDGKLYLVPAKQLPTMRRLEKLWTRLQKGTGKRNTTGRSGNSSVFRVPRSQTLEMLALRASGTPVIGGARWQKICDFYDGLEKKRAPRHMPKSVRADLLPYQNAGVQWLRDLYSLGLGAILADDMGLGKTLQTLAFLESLRATSGLGHALVVVPTSLTYNWLSECERFTPELRIATLTTSKDTGRIAEFLAATKDAIVLTTYGILAEQSAFFNKHKWSVAIFDEAQHIKNITAKRTTAARSLQARFKVCLTGTPLENHMGELYSILDLAVPGSMGELAEFNRKYVTPASVPTEDIAELKLTCKPLILRRAKSEILKQLPPKSENKVVVAFTERQKKIYRDIAIAYNEEIQQTIAKQGESKSQLQMLTALLRLRQACSDPAALPGVKFSEKPPKISTLLESLEEIMSSGESALVFTQFLSTYHRIEKELDRAGIPCYGIHGGLSRTQRERELSGFQNHGPRGAVMLMTLKTGGVGLNLTKASYVFHIEPWWNPAVENQATDRAHRIGQERPVQVYRYIMHESVEEKIETLKGRKEKRFAAMFTAGDVEDTGELHARSGMLTQRDFEYLLRQDSP